MPTRRDPRAHAVAAHARTRVKSSARVRAPWPTHRRSNGRPRRDEHRHLPIRVWSVRLTCLAGLCSLYYWLGRADEERGEQAKARQAADDFPARRRLSRSSNACITSPLPLSSFHPAAAGWPRLDLAGRLRLLLRWGQGSLSLGRQICAAASFVGISAPRYPSLGSIDLPISGSPSPPHESFQGRPCTGIRASAFISNSTAR